MSFSIDHRGGGSAGEPSLDDFSALYDELDHVDNEHPSVSVGHESEWTLSAYGGGLLVWENVDIEYENIPPQHMKNVSKQKTLELWRKLAEGDISAVQSEPWLPGYG